MNDATFIEVLVVVVFLAQLYILNRIGEGFRQVDDRLDGIESKLSEIGTELAAGEPPETPEFFRY